MAEATPGTVSPQRNSAPKKLNPSGDEHSSMPDALDYVPITPSDLVDKAKEIKRNLQDTHRHKSEVVKMVMINQTPSIPTEFGNRLGNLRVSLSLVTVINQIADNQFRQARKQAQKALTLAEASKDKLSVARCHYWMGRIEFEKQNMEAAHDHFLAARPCVMDDFNPEGETVRFYLEASKRGISEQYLKRILLQHNKALIESAPHERPFKRPYPSSRKRKREVQPWKVLLRPAASDKTGRRQKQSLGVSSTKPHTILNEWIVRDLPDLPFRPKTCSSTSEPDPPPLNCHDDFHPTEQPTEAFRKDDTTGEMGAHNARPLEGMAWLEAASSQPRLEQRGQFTLRCYPIGLASRTRSTDIFSKLPSETLLSDQEWESLKSLMSNRAITMAYLAKERQLRLFKEKKSSGVIEVEGD
ncbi:uncharacterized protein N7496_007157 [Penicillium cataractarum]|uniref:Uncharacterized protein n=1 Tax=Penicillium cataractarum TaxID=2100454 RepID=A0A9W9V984_9EURO|nr:uncharacterized protein N7496_007157 [Penicillium cataractarum]KAJ5371065.1 hypothetical protein N7496_007157 [Penicillium cataractarum]